MRAKLAALFIICALAAVAWPLPASAQISITPGSSARGAQIFREKSCVECHANAVPAAPTPMVLATALWNHSPKMWRAQQDRRVRPMLDSEETADLFAYFFSLAYFTAPGDPGRGATVFDKKSCNRCHAVAIDRRIAAAHHTTPETAPPISTWSEVGDPLMWAERMWNHSGAVYAELASAGVPWPKFTAAEMVDLLTYLRSTAPSPSAHFQPGDPELGRLVFEASCQRCHSFGGHTADPKIDLVKRPVPDLLIGYTTAMWNHAPLMRQKAGNTFPILSPGDMSNLVAYLFEQRFFEEEGNAERGARVFEAKNCAICHELNRERTHAPDLAKETERFSPVTVAAAVWRHGPAMLQTMREQDIAWPTFKGTEMQDLIAFLNKRLVIRVGNREK